MKFVKTPTIIKKMLPRLIWNIAGENSTIYLTFDDGPTPEVTTWVLDLLFQYNAKATFFCLGEKVEKYPDIFHRIIAEGHSVGNHTYHHLKGFKTKVSDFMEDVEKANLLIHSNLFRPPYGKVRLRQISELKKTYKIVMWDIISYDYDSNVSQNDCLKNVIQNTENGSIIVFHDSLMAENNLRYVLPEVLKYFSQKEILFGRIV